MKRRNFFAALLGAPMAIKATTAVKPLTVKLTLDATGYLYQSSRRARLDEGVSVSSR